MASRIRAVFCDLDDTLFDHRQATRTALGGLRTAEPAFEVWPAAEFERRHHEILEVLHLEVLAGSRTIDSARRERFVRLLRAAGVEDVAVRAEAAADWYGTAYADAWRAVPGAVDLARAIVARGLPLVIVTNNKVAEQRRKLEFCGLTPLVTALITSEEVGVSKPAAGIFTAALEEAGVDEDSAVMFGDAWTSDIVGARQAGLAAVWFNPSGRDRPDPSIAEVRSLEPAVEVLQVLLNPWPARPV